MIGEAIYKIEKNPPRLRITKAVNDMLKHLGPEMKFSNRIIVSNLWLFGPAFKKSIFKN